MKKVAFLIFVLSFQFGYSQKRVQQGVIYSEGEKVYGPMGGVESVIPKNWMGISPQGSESFLLIPSDNSNAQIIVLVVEDSMDEIKKRWQNKFEFSNNIFLEVDGKAKERNGWLSADIKITGSTASPMGFAEANCGNWGVCLISLLVADEKDIANHKKSLISFSDSTVFSEPTISSRYDDFDWLSFLQNKALIRWSSNPNYKTNNQVHLCKDGKFQSRIKTRGIVKGEKSPYFGKNWGEWEVQSNGATAKLYLYFNKLSPLIVDLEMRKGGKLFINNIQYFSMDSNKCGD